MKALTFSTFGSPDVLKYIDVPQPILKADDVLVEMKAIGLNYVVRCKVRYVNMA